MKINVKVSSKCFNPVYLPYLEDTTYLQIFYGGSSSGKSYFLAQRCIWDMLHGGHNYLIVRKVARTVRKSVYNEITKAIHFFKAGKLFSENKSEMVITGPNGFQIMFAGLDDVEKVKSITPAKGVITDIWIEEARPTMGISSSCASACAVSPSSRSASSSRSIRSTRRTGSIRSTSRGAGMGAGRATRVIHFLSSRRRTATMSS